jgi:hypothetical protein
VTSFFCWHEILYVPEMTLSKQMVRRPSVQLTGSQHWLQVTSKTASVATNNQYCRSIVSILLTSTLCEQVQCLQFNFLQWRWMVLRCRSVFVLADSLVIYCYQRHTPDSWSKHSEGLTQARVTALASTTCWRCNRCTGFKPRRRHFSCAYASSMHLRRALVALDIAGMQLVYWFAMITWN